MAANGGQMMSRAEVAERLAALAGDNILRVTEAADGWPALGLLRTDDGDLPVALYVAPVGLSHRNRDHIERRFQNPGAGRPINDLRPNREPLLLGLWESDPVLDVGRPIVISADPYRRIGRTTRVSIFVTTASLQAALATGWSAEHNTTGERIHCFSPSLLTVSHLTRQQDDDPPPGPLHNAIAASGVLVANGDEVAAATKRIRRVASVLGRDAQFSRRVLGTYGGRCAMCGLGGGLVQGAHIYPVAAPGSFDEPWNGLALCGNHHLAFDRHLIGIDPDTCAIAFDESTLGQAPASPALDAFVGGTFRELAMPHTPQAAPRPEMLIRRYSFFAGQYTWFTDT